MLKICWVPGAVTRVLARQPGVTEAVGIDPSPVFIAKARELASAAVNLAFEQGDGRSLPFADGGFDVVVLHTTLCHVPQPEQVLAEAFRVLRPDGTVTLATATTARPRSRSGECDPLQECIEAVKAAFIHELWLVRRLRALLRSSGSRC